MTSPSHQTTRLEAGRYGSQGWPPLLWQCPNAPPESAASFPACAPVTGLRLSPAVALKKNLKELEFRGRNVLRSLLVPGALRALRHAAEQAATVEEFVALAANFNHLRIKIAPSQNPVEIAQLLKLLSEQPPKTLLEIGTAKGGTFFLFSRVAAPDALLISLDLPLQRSGLGSPAWRDKLCRSFARAQQRIELVRADSHKPATAEGIRQLLGDRLVDFLLIDGDHSYEGAKTDYELYSPLVARGGLIGFHDIVPVASDRNNGVPQLWQELKKSWPFMEFVADWGQGAFGIGVVKNSSW